MGNPTPETENAIELKDVLSALTESTNSELLRWLDIPIEKNDDEYSAEYVAVTGSFAYKVKFMANDDWTFKIVVGNEYPIYFQKFCKEEFPEFTNSIKENFLDAEIHFVGCLQDLMHYEQQVSGMKSNIITPQGGVAK